MQKKVARSDEYEDKEDRQWMSLNLTRLSDLVKYPLGSLFSKVAVLGENLAGLNSLSLQLEYGENVAYSIPLS